MEYKSDIEIAQSCQMRHITEIAKSANVDEKYIEQYGNYKAKIDPALIKETDKKDGKLILITRTPWGDGVERRGTFELMNTKTGETLELISRHGFKDKNRFDFFSALYEVDYEDIENLCFCRKGEIVQKNWLSGDWKIDFKAEPKMEDIILETADENIEIRCSKISMGISGNLPEMEYMQIFLADGTEVSCVSSTPERVIFQKPINPEEIASIIYNGEELLK